MEREPTFDLHKPKIEMPIFQTIWSERLDEIKQDILDHKKEFLLGLNVSFKSCM